MNKREGIFFFNTEQRVRDDGRNHDSASSKKPHMLAGEIVPLRDGLFIDDHLSWNVKHQMDRTAQKQANLIVQVRRQAELDLIRVEQAMELRTQALVTATDWLDFNYQLVDSYARGRPELANRVREMVEDAAEDLVRLPKAGMILFLRRYALG